MENKRFFLILLLFFVHGLAKWGRDLDLNRTMFTEYLLIMSLSQVTHINVHDSLGVIYFVSVIHAFYENSQ